MEVYVDDSVVLGVSDVMSVIMEGEMEQPLICGLGINPTKMELMLFAAKARGGEVDWALLLKDLVAGALMPDYAIRLGIPYN